MASSDRPRWTAGAHLVGGDQTDVLGQPGQAVGVALVRPALGERRVQQGADGLRVGALWGLGTDAAQRRVHGEAADTPLTGRGAQDGVGVQTQMGEALAVGGGHRGRHLADHLVGVVRLQRPWCEERGQLDGVGQPLVDDVDEVVLLDGVEDLDEPGIAEQGGGAGRCQDGTRPGVVRGQDVHADRATELLVHRAPAAESVQTGDAFLKPVASGEFVAAVQFGR